VKAVSVLSVPVSDLETLTRIYDRFLALYFARA
jgi:hypothetical protein